MSWERRGRRGYRGLLRLLPRRFRSRFGMDMEELFVSRLREARGPLGRTWVWIRAAADVARHGVTERIPRAKGAGAGEGRAVTRVSLAQDVRYGIRSLVSAPLFALAAIATLALGIGASTATFSVVHAVLLKEMPYAEPDRLVVVWPEVNANKAMAILAEERMESLASVSGVSLWTLTLTGIGDPQEITGSLVSPGHFDLLGVRPAMGRTFTTDEAMPGAASVVILSHDFWVRAFGADPDVLGRSVAIAGADHDRRTVIGVMPPTFENVEDASDVWVPLEGDPSLPVEEDETWYVNTRVARLAPGASLERANAEVKAYAAEVQRRAPWNFSEEEAAAATVQPLRAFRAGAVGPVLWVLLGAVSLVLLIACANVANLLLARGEARGRDLSVRVALGASRGRLVSMLLVETGLLGVLGGVLGVGAALLMVETLVSQAPEDFPAIESVSVNPSVLAFAVIASFVAILASGVYPAISASRMKATGTLGGGARGASGRRSAGLSKTLIGVQVAFAVVVTVGSGLTLRSLDRLLSVDPGMDGSAVLTLRPNPPAGRYPDGVAFREYYADVLERISSVPSVEAVGGIQLLPGTSGNWSFPTYVEGSEIAEGDAVPSVNFRAVRGDYFRALRIPLTAGRLVGEGDRADTESVVTVNQAFADRFWPGEDPIGRTVRIFSPTASPARVVGVVADVRQHSRSAEPRPEMYYGHEQVPWDQMSMHLMVRVRSGRPLDHAASIQDVIWSVDPDVPISQIRDMSAVLAGSTRTTRFFALLLSAFGSLALALGGIGVFGVTAYTVGRRIPEFGVRMALGSSRTGVLHVAARLSVGPVVLGLVAGLLAAAATSGLLESVLYGVEPTDPATFIGVAIVLLAVASIASAIPAYKASRIDPATVLNGE